MLVPFINLFILFGNHSSKLELCVFYIFHSKIYFFRLEFEVLNPLIGRSCLHVKLFELPVAYSKQSTVEEKYLGKPINSGIKGALVRNCLDRILLFLLSLIFVLSRILDKGV